MTPRRKELLDQLTVLLKDVPATQTPWEAILIQLESMPLRHLAALAYRVQSSLTASFDAGLRHGHALAMKGEPLP